jgi:hypothetical protein
LRGWIIVGRNIIVTIFLEHMCISILRVMGKEGQETKRFHGARNQVRMLVACEDTFVSLWESGSGKNMLGGVGVL